MVDAVEKLVEFYRLKSIRIDYTLGVGKMAIPPDLWWFSGIRP
jgi:hypothetical protein